MVETWAWWTGGIRGKERKMTAVILSLNTLCHSASRRGCSRAGKRPGKRKTNQRITDRSKQKNKSDPLQGGEHCCMTVPSLSFPKDAVRCWVTNQARPSVWPRLAVSRVWSPLLHCCQFHCFVMWPCSNPFLLFLSLVIHRWADITASVVIYWLRFFWANTVSLYMFVEHLSQECVISSGLSCIAVIRIIDNIFLLFLPVLFLLTKNIDCDWPQIASKCTLSFQVHKAPHKALILKLEVWAW